MFTRPAALVAVLALSFTLLLGAACRDASPDADGDGNGQTATSSAVDPELPPPDSQVQPTVTPIPPSPTPSEPLAAAVNGEPITLAAFEEALSRQQQGQSLILQEPDPNVDEGAQVLNMLIERALIEQAAEANGISVTTEMVEAQLAELRQVAEGTGGEGSFEAWLQANQWSEASFREALAYEMLTERVSAFVTADVPQTVPQVRARYIQVDDQALAESLSEQIANGADFAALAREHSLDQATAADGGDLGYFAQGTLLVPELEEAAFALQPGEVSNVITATGANGGQTVYYLVQVVDLDPERPLGPDQRAALLQERFEAWLVEQWSQAEIERYIDTGA
ncbi:MAG TPA: SurA N-terminal domain-containing protein [Candidatus Sulfomarinibacteraceae bacterium]|nr:SurA N-terminal domain-containing protein [Candidatus Sulfomarinibacteraceae bacterium]